MNNLKESTKKLLLGINIKKIIKISLALVISMGIIGGGAALAYKYYENKQELKAKEAQSTILKNQAVKEKIDLKSEEEIKNIVSQTIGVDLKNIYFEEIYLVSGFYDKEFYHKNNKWYKQRNGLDFLQENNQNTTNDIKKNNNLENQNEQDQLSSSNSNVDSNNQSTPSTNIEQNYIYKIELEANSLDYDLFVNAKTGDVLSVRVDN
ncbi:PepSY domain-containing protein [Gemelliphila palaticanis]|uniref:PepSY domain-containing protein n=1 Tax=Gemelliphila palaticanis TaxID=81950 RepID=A0ABX2SYL7_9BACL|nr:PepSY domain-containing protein [Gemella palaticanis]MBF0715177.1 PepSY domain-containing protein [Gemella palaticanis]NYS47107.1 PepSY domain-containing protein [Gemella palaticanis]